MKSNKNRKIEILLVDDKPENLKVLVHLLEENYKVLVATGGERALSQIIQRKPDLILLDILMPEMDGFDTCKAIKANPDLVDIPVIFITALSDTDSIVKAFSAGGVDYISKPFIQEEVLARIEAHLTIAVQKKERDDYIEKISIQNAEYQSLNEEYFAQIEELRTLGDELGQKNDELGENKEKLEEAQRIAQLGHWELNIVENKLSWSDEIFRIFNLKPQEFEATYEAFLDNIHPDDRDKVNEVYTNSLKNKTPYEIEHRILLKTGEIKYVNERCETEYDKEGKPVHSMGTVQDITARKMFELKQEEQSIFINTLLENLEVGVVACNAEGTLTYFNKTSEEFHGLAQKKIPSDKWAEHYDLYLPDGKTIMNTADIPLYKALKGEQFNDIEMMIIPKKGKAYTLLAGGRPLLDVNGQIQGAVVVMYDITERKKSKEEIDKQAKFMDILFKNSLDSMAILDKDYNFVKVSEAYAKATQREASSFIGKNHFELYPSDFKEDADLVKKSKKLYYKEARPFTYPDHPEWGVTYWDLGFVPVWDDEKEIELFILTLKDVTEHTKAKQELHKQNHEYASLNEEYKTQNEELLIAKDKAEESEQKFSAITNQTVEGITVADMDGNYVFVNPAFCKMSGYSKEDLLKMTVFDMKAKKQPQKSFYDSKEEMEGLPIRVNLQRKDGTEYLTEIVGKVIKIDNQQWVLGTIRDITERVKKEKELIIAKDKAEESDRLKTEFLNNMSHEIRTPMNGILGFSKMLSKPGKSEKKKQHYVDIIQNSGNQLMRIIDDILEISQLGTSQVMVQNEEFCLNDLLLEQFTIFDVKAKENKTPLYLKKGLSDKESTILTDKLKLVKILGNLLENALKFTHEGFIEFGYSLHEKIIQIYVKDTGIGISPENQFLIFKRFSQEEKELSKNVGGLGLGLSIAKENAELLGGTITLKSEKGKGATFFVTIPHNPVNVKTEGNYSDKEKRVSKPDKYIFLIVEDEEVNHLYLEALLEDIDSGIKTIHAKDGREAVEICRNQQEINMVLMDLKMPVMNGFEASRQIKALLPDLPIIAQTAYSTKADREKALKAGCDDFISKPISEETLSEIIHRYLITKTKD